MGDRLGSFVGGSDVGGSTYPVGSAEGIKIEGFTDLYTAGCDVPESRRLGEYLLLSPICTSAQRSQQK